MNGYTSERFIRRLANRIAECTGKHQDHIYSELLTPIFEFFQEKIDEIQMESGCRLSNKGIEGYLLEEFPFDLREKYQRELGGNFNDNMEKNVDKFFDILMGMIEEGNRKKWEGSVEVLEGLG